MQNARWKSSRHNIWTTPRGTPPRGEIVAGADGAFTEWGRMIDQVELRRMVFNGNCRLLVALSVMAISCASVFGATSSPATQEADKAAESLRDQYLMGSLIIFRAALPDADLDENVRAAMLQATKEWEKDIERCVAEEKRNPLNEQERRTAAFNVQKKFNDAIKAAAGNRAVAVRAAQQNIMLSSELAALDSGEVLESAKVLELTQDQQEELKKLLKETNTKLKPLGEPKWGYEKTSVARVNILLDARGKMRELLTTDQREQWNQALRDRVVRMYSEVNRSLANRRKTASPATQP